MNSTHIVLILKKEKPQNMSYLRPISLCNVTYKIVAKILRNRLKPILLSLISKYQSAFIPGRLITDNMMLAFEICHYMKRQRNGKVGRMAGKVDMSKAYYRVEWQHLQDMMQKMGSNERWLDFIIMCLRSVTYKVLHDRAEIELMNPTGGLRQGDPLSLYLIILCAKGLSSSLRALENRGLIQGFKVSCGAPPISYLFFADDSYFYLKSKNVECTQIKSCPQMYENV